MVGCVTACDACGSRVMYNSSIFETFSSATISLVSYLFMCFLSCHTAYRRRISAPRCSLISLSQLAAKVRLEEEEMHGEVSETLKNFAQKSRGVFFAAPSCGLKESKDVPAERDLCQRTITNPDWSPLADVTHAPTPYIAYDSSRWATTT